MADNPWEVSPKLEHLSGNLREQMERRRRHKKVRYLLFRLQTAEESGRPVEEVDGLPDKFAIFWLGEEPLYSVDHRKNKLAVPINKRKKVRELGGYSAFAKIWDVDEDLIVYIRHSTIWQEWNSTLHRVVPILGED